VLYIVSFGSNFDANLFLFGLIKNSVNQKLY